MDYLGYELDPFQEQAVRAIDGGRSVIIAAPTGCGKTLVAEYAIDVSLRKGQRVIYTAPIKSLSNQKYRDFRHRFGEERVGIHTGDVTVNPHAAVLIMTTEIFRNLILEESPRLDDVYYVVFDEIHYLDDEERGTVWEESLILAPEHIRCLCLSATVPNVHELAAWMAQVRGMHFDVIEEHARPVPLSYILFSPRHGEVTIKDIRRLYKRKQGLRKRYLRNRGSPGRIVRTVIEDGRFPALYFAFNRRACERNAERYASQTPITPHERERVRDLVDTLVEQYGLEDYQGIMHMRRLWEYGCAYHHAGMLPAAKEIVEQLFTAGLIKLLFCTETFALGINMPAKAVVIDELEKFNGVDFTYLMTRSFNQIAGRAGRRGMDSRGYVYAQVIPEATDPAQVDRILYGKNERIYSRFVASYSTILTLYSQFGERCYDIFRKSLRNYRSGQFGLTRSYRKQEVQIENRIAFLKSRGFLEGTELTEKGCLAAKVSGYEIQTAELYSRRIFHACTPAQAAVILCGLITEESSRTRRHAAVGSALAVKFSSPAEKVIRGLRRAERAHNIREPIPEMNFAYAGPVLSWVNGASFNELLAYGLPEGDIVRAFRMTVQLLRTLRDMLPDKAVAEKMHEALMLVNRDVVDAQAQLRVG